MERTGQPATGARPARRLLDAFVEVDGYGPVLLSIVLTYALAIVLADEDAGQVIVLAQILNVWLVFRVAQARPSIRRATNYLLALSAVAAAATLFGLGGGDGPALSTASCLLYFIAPAAVVRHLVSRRVIDVETILGAIAAYLLIGMFFAFAYQLVASVQSTPFFGADGDGTIDQNLFFSFTTMLTIGFGNLVPAGNPGQSMAVAEGLTGQLFLVVAVAKAVASWRPAPRSGESPGTEAG
ncbi:MAG: two pore domain potassium channel family protein [Solirubrobacterales bacterium]|nr:two pore domain potassium channel family protein [Solirubrobacterales bacterium]